MNPASSNTLQRKVENAPRILIVRVGAMGDVIHALPAVASLRARLPEAHIGWAIEPRWASLLRVDGAGTRDPERMPLVDVVHPVEAKQWNQAPASLRTLRSILALRRSLRAQNYDVAIDLQGTLRSAVIARMSGARNLVGSDAPRERAARAFYRLRVPRVATHVVDQAMDLVMAAMSDMVRSQGFTLQSQDRPPEALSLLPRDREAEAEWQRTRHSLCGQRRPVLLAATAGWGAKEWPPHNFAAVAAALVDAGHPVLLNAAPGPLDPVTAEVLRIVNSRYPAQSSQVHPLPATLPLLIAATREALAVIAGDTGPLHLAEAVGTPALGLFGPTDPARTGPRRNSICLRDAESVTDHRRHAHTETGLAHLRVDTVMQAFETLLPRTVDEERDEH